LTAKLNYSNTELRMQAKVTMNLRGAITIPARLRKALGLLGNDELIIEKTAQGLLLRPVFSVPVELYTEERLAELAGQEEAVAALLAKPGSKGAGKSKA
jgi:AbrB family looped-hinge helix DNA binding protein